MKNLDLNPKENGTANKDFVNNVRDNSSEVTGYVPTQYELVQLVKHWEEFAISVEFVDQFLMGTTSSKDLCRMYYAWDRIDLIEKLIGRLQVRKAVEEAKQEFRKRNPRKWDIYVEGRDPECRALQEEMGFHFSNSCKCKWDGPIETHLTTDWDWIEEETRLHREGKCSAKSRSDLPESSTGE